MRSIRALFSIIALTALTSFESRAATGDFKIAYGTSIAGIAGQAVHGYEEASKEKVVVMQDLGMSSDSVLILVARGLAELGVSGNSWDNILELVKTKKLEINDMEKIQHSVLGIDHIKVATYPGGPKALTKDQLKMIFSGQVLNWKDVGGEDSPIQIVLAARTPATEQTFAKAILDGEDIYRKGSKTLQTMKESGNYIKEHKGAIGLTSGGNEMPGLNFPTQPSIEKTITALTLGEPTERAKKFMEQVSKAIAH